MNCPRCGAASRVVESRPGADMTIRRRRECEYGHRFTTFEVHEPHPLQMHTLRQLLKTISARIHLTQPRSKT